jgi:hypothetical protein
MEELALRGGDFSKDASLSSILSSLRLRIEEDTSVHKPTFVPAAAHTDAANAQIIGIAQHGDGHALV